MKKEISELTKIQLIKRNNGYMIAFLCGILAALFLLAGAAISFSGKKVALGVALLAIAVLSAVVPLILYLWKRKKYLPLAVNKWAEDITATLAKQTGQRKFRAYEGVEAEFFADEVVVNGKHYKKEEAEAVYCVCVQPRLIYDEVELAVEHWWNDEQQTERKRTYLKIFEHLFPKIVEEVCPYLPYVPSSPSSFGELKFRFEPDTSNSPLQMTVS